MSLPLLILLLLAIIIILFLIFDQRFYAVNLKFYVDYDLTRQWQRDHHEENRRFSY